MPSSPPEANLFLLFTSRLNELRVPYIVSGSVAAMIYGEPRLTNDVDLVAFLTPEIAVRLPTVFPSEEFYCPPPDVLAIETVREQRGHFNIVHIATGFKADVYLRGNDPLHFWALERARVVPIAGANVRVAPIEYVIIRKLQYFREGGSQKHLRDIQAMLRGAMADQVELNRLIQEYGLAKEWDSVEKA